MLFFNNHNRCGLCQGRIYEHTLLTSHKNTIGPHASLLSLHQFASFSYDVGYCYTIYCYQVWKLEIVFNYFRNEIRFIYIYTFADFRLYTFLVIRVILFCSSVSHIVYCPVFECVTFKSTAARHFDRIQENLITFCTSDALNFSVLSCGMICFPWL